MLICYQAKILNYVIVSSGKSHLISMRLHAYSYLKLVHEL